MKKIVCISMFLSIMGSYSFAQTASKAKTPKGATHVTTTKSAPGTTKAVTPASKTKPTAAKTNTAAAAKTPAPAAASGKTKMKKDGTPDMRYKENKAAMHHGENMGGMKHDENKAAMHHGDHMGEMKHDENKPAEQHKRKMKHKEEHQDMSH